ncbi:hypothetical protein NOSIN_23705 [Nocardiopsis sinuspersici]|uniref:Tyr recombinase domain-containing protein n=1 Tax=Nocardiopsis sinuspersici TaxID=501010 RepID=A0A1V3C9E5_9ACTN|nr:hypothetical protein NOSIN_23705 [Nocardiopsis sinuspersici]
MTSGRRPRPVLWTQDAQREWERGGDRPAVAVWSVQHTRSFLDFVAGHRLYALFHLVVLLGLRRGEVLGLRWRDVDLDARVLHVESQVQQVGGCVVVAEPKSEASRRTVALDQVTVQVLRAHRRKQQSERSGTGRADPDLVFTCIKGGCLAPDRLSRSFRKLNTESGLPPVRLHDLRHGAATFALAAGVDLKTVQAMLGHASIVLTADTYTSVLPEVAHEAAEATAALVLRDARSARVRHRALRRRRKRRGGPMRAPPGSHQGNARRGSAGVIPGERW